MAKDKQPEKVVGHWWTDIPQDQWKRTGIDFQEAVKTCKRCEVEVKMRRKIEFDGFAPRFPVAFREKGGDWVKMYHSHGNGALPVCVTLEEHLKAYKENH